MSMGGQLPDLSIHAATVRAALAWAQAGLVDREVLSEVVVLSAVAREHVLVVGPPGTAKSEAVRRVARVLGGAYFEYLLGRFTEPNEIFGPVDLQRLRDGVVEVRTENMLPEADVAFLDEVFLGSTAILNTLLGILNERAFRRGNTVADCPLRVCVGAANRLPEDPALEAFADRFLARVFVAPVSDARLEDLLAADDAQRESPPRAGLDGALDALTAAATACDHAAVRPFLGVAVRRLRGAGVHLSDRRVVRGQRLIASAAALAGRTSSSAEDLWVLPLIARTVEEQARTREVLADLLADARNESLLHAAEEYARGPAALAARLTSAGRAVLAQEGPSVRLRAEALLREIDAGFASADLTADLAAVRSGLVATVRGGDGPPGSVDGEVGVIGGSGR